ncbi:MAG TPA: carbon storage regulator [Planctomycetaceae bacterium]|nr:carbon storage regulator [Planctomycetaceae bacterium]
MLVLSRRKDQGIVISDGITITVSEIRGDRVRLAISAPDSVRILRRELLDIVGEIELPLSTVRQG